ncbi:MAG: hypothetical protein KatS3mg102_0234 [Planctomycetota bacterium]|nr:MAG: hypothetical protein KatS3mg102_0234 [Planctomycetota bacterium]
MPIKGIFEQLFGRKKEVTSRDLKVALLGLKREARKKRMQMRKLESRRSELVDRIKRARREGSGVEVDVLWEELRQVRIDTAYLKRESKVVALEMVGLTRYLRGLERLERSGDQNRIRSLIERVRVSGLDEKLRGAEVDEAAYIDELNATLDEVGIEIESWETEEADPDKARFLEEIDAINAAEAAGQLDEALEREEKLAKRLEEEPVSESEL